TSADRAASGGPVARILARMQAWSRSLAVGRDVLGEYRDRIMLPIASAAVVLLVPFALVDFLVGQALMGLLALAVVLPLGLDTVALWRHRRPPVPYGWMLLPVGAAIAAALLQHGVHGAMWCYPAILFCYFVLPGWQATAGALGLLALTTGLVWHVLGVATMGRFAVTAGLSIVILHVILGVVGELQRKLFEQATTDPLTGALNRRQLVATLADAIEMARRSERPVSLVAFDLDHFKRINDRHGHAAGDEVLQRVVALVRERARRLDRLFRMGGEEFALLLPNTGVADAMRVAEVLRLRIAEAGWLGPGEVTISAGVAQLHRKHGVDSWLKAADDALYRAKADGRNCIRVASRGRPAPTVAGDAGEAGETGDGGEAVEFLQTRPSDLAPLSPSDWMTLRDAP
ncbi:MAG TPA: GGDEF domain-containing protein, partial [Burkholderiaceae bacterium]